MRHVDPPKLPSPSEGSSTAIARAPVFIAGFPRSGTTLLFRILHRHSAFCGAGSDRGDELDLVESHFYRRFARPAAALWRSEDEVSLRTWFGGCSEYYNQFLAQSLRAFHIAAAAGRNRRRILDKTPDNVLIAPLIAHAFPDARVLCLRRDPRDVLASFRRRRELQTGEAGAWLDIAYDLEEFAEAWLCQSNAWREFSVKSPEKSMLVDFRSLTQDPGTVVKQVLKFVGAEFEVGMIRGIAPQQRSDPLDGYVSHVPVPNSRQWPGLLTSEEARVISERCPPFGTHCLDSVGDD